MGRGHALSGSCCCRPRVPAASGTADAQAGSRSFHWQRGRRARQPEPPGPAALRLALSDSVTHWQTIMIARPP